MKPPIEVDAAKMIVRAKGKDVHLSPTEYKTFMRLLFAKGSVVSRNDILREVYGYSDNVPDTRTIDQHVSRLKRKIGVNFIRTVSGFGYSMIGGTVAEKSFDWK